MRGSVLEYVTSIRSKLNAAGRKKTSPAPGAGFFDFGKASLRRMRGGVLEYVTSIRSKLNAAISKKDKPGEIKIRLCL